MKLKSLALIVGSTIMVTFPCIGSDEKEVPWVRMIRERCYGTCPQYELAISADGNVVFIGKRFTIKEGRHEAHIRSEVMAQIRDAIESAQFLKLSENCCQCQEVSDSSSVTVEVYQEAGKKTIRHYHGCRSAPASLGKLEDQIDQLTGAVQWIGTPEERQKIKRH